MSQPMRWGVERRNNFNFLRLLLAVTVIYSHASPLLQGSAHLDLMGTILHDQIDQIGDHPIDSGHLAVYGFFVISGFLISMSWHNTKGFWAYLEKRILRIYPAFLAGMVVTILIFGPSGATDREAYWSKLAQHALRVMLDTANLSADWEKAPFTQSFISNPYPHIVNGSIWTIRYEFICYLFVALLGTLGMMLTRLRPPKISRFAPATFFFCVFMLYAGRLHGHFNWWGRLDEHFLTTRLLGGAIGLPRLFVYFAAGMCAYAYRSRLRFSVPLLIGSIVVLLASALVPALLPLTLPIFGSYALLALAFAPWLRLDRIGTKRDLSYGIYLYAFPIQQLLVMYLGSELTPWTAFFVALPPTILCAWLSWHLIERPALRLKPNPNSNRDCHRFDHAQYSAQEIRRNTGQLR